MTTMERNAGLLLSLRAVGVPLHHVDRSLARACYPSGLRVALEIAIIAPAQASLDSSGMTSTTDRPAQVVGLARNTATGPHNSLGSPLERLASYSACPAVPHDVRGPVAGRKPSRRLWCPW
jgi:hypothetical protein